MVSDFLKLVYDPYMTGLNFSEQNLQCKIDLTMEYVIEVTKITNSDFSLFLDNPKIEDQEGHPLMEYFIQTRDEYDQEKLQELRDMISRLILELRDLTSNYMDYRINGIKVPTNRQVKAITESTKEEKFKPSINKKSHVLSSKQFANFAKQQKVEESSLMMPREITNLNLQPVERQRQTGKIVSQKSAKEQASKRSYQENIFRTSGSMQ